MKEEIFKKYTDKYSVSNYGNIRNDSTNKILKVSVNHKGYLKTNLSINGKLKTVFPHILVANLFLKKQKENLQVNHKDGNKLNNKVTNLEWVTASENIKHAYINGLNKGNGITVYQKDLNGNIIASFKSCREAAKYMGNINASSIICRVCHNQRKSYKGYKWSYN